MGLTTVVDGPEGKLGKRTRISKRQLKHDALLETAAKGTRFIEEHLNKVLMGALVIIVVIVAVTLVGRSRTATENAATAALSEATQTLNAGLFAQAAAQYEALIDTYPGTRSAGAATCYLGTIAFYQTDFDAAAARFDEYLDRFGRRGNLSRIALEGKASIHEERREFELAANIYEEMARDAVSEPSAAARYLNKAMTMRRSAGDWEAVRTLATTIIDDHQESVWEPYARTALAEAEAHIAG